MIKSALIALVVIFLLLLNLANLFGRIGLSGPVPAMIWFAISFCGVFYLYKFCGAKPVAARIGIFAVAFVGGFFTSVLYYGFFNSQTLEFAFTYAVAEKRQRHAHDGREAHHHRDIDARINENERGKRARKDPYQIIAFKIVVQA